MNAVLAPKREAPVARRKSTAVSTLVGAFESETAAVFVRTAPSRQHIILYVLVGIIALSILLSAVVKLDRVVTSVGRIVTTAGALYVSPFDTGIVKQINVKAGDIVKKGQVLATLDPTFTHADLVQLQQKLASDEAAVARLTAELAGKKYKFSSADPAQLLQGGIWQKRQAEYKSNLDNFDGQIRATQAQVAQYQADAKGYQQHLKTSQDVEKLYKPLLEKGYVSKLQVMQAADGSTEQSRLLGDAQNQIKSSTETLAALRAQRSAYIEKWHSDTGTELVTTRDGLDVTRQNLEKAQKLADLVSLNAPADAVVLNVGKVSSGSVAGGAEQGASNEDPLFTLVPLDAPQEADVNVDAHDIGFIKAGDLVQIKLDAYRFLQHGTAKGRIKSVSEGSFTVDDNNTPVPPYFKVRVAVTDTHLRDVPKDY